MSHETCTVDWDRSKEAWSLRLRESCQAGVRVYRIQQPVTILAFIHETCTVDWDHSKEAWSLRLRGVLGLESPARPLFKSRYCCVKAIHAANAALWHPGE